MDPAVEQPHHTSVTSPQRATGHDDEVPAAQTSSPGHTGGLVGPISGIRPPYHALDAGWTGAFCSARGRRPRGIRFLARVSSPDARSLDHRAQATVLPFDSNSYSCQPTPRWPLYRVGCTPVRDRPYSGILDSRGCQWVEKSVGCASSGAPRRDHPGRSERPPTSGRAGSGTTCCSVGRAHRPPRGTDPISYPTQYMGPDANPASIRPRRHCMRPIN